jgi:hypothetical protein
MTPTKASAFDIGGMVGTAMAIQMQMNAYRGLSGGYHARSRASHHDSDSDDSGGSSGSSRISGGGERDARDAETVDRASRPDNKLAMHRQVLGPSSNSDGLTQASERDAAVEQGPGPRRAFDDHPAFNPSR